MDEILHDHVKRLKAIDDRLDMMERAKPGALPEAIRGLRIDLAKMISDAEDEYAAF